MLGCIFCNFIKNKAILEENLAFVVIDDFPVTPGHSLIIPKRHFSDFFEIKNDELLDIQKLIVKRKNDILNTDKTVEGFNVGINIGTVAGQSIFHMHVHLIPRRFKDIENPKGGVRGIIPEKRSY